MFGVNIWTSFGADDIKDYFLRDGGRAILLKNYIYRRGSIPYKMVVCGVRNNGGGEREFITEESEECIPLVL